MSASIISAEHISKSYLIRHQGARSGGGYRRLSEELTAALTRRIRGWSIRPNEAMTGRPSLETFWALREVSFELKQGEVLGVIGRNGAGKSTLLKVLSRITEPTEGRITLRGRVASLLEVGTGFHPELTGRENIFLNGAILGMSRAEIRTKFDEIVAFADVETFLDTPVKRYSSGMYVRLAFAVAAHLDPEILLVDEVLAVGDAKFQKKCLGKMQEVSEREGRTVLFVSHNMAMISSLCGRALLLDEGRVRADGSAGEVIIKYANAGHDSPAAFDYRERKMPGDSVARLLSGAVTSKDGRVLHEIPISTPFVVRMDYSVTSGGAPNLVPNFHFHRADGSCAFVTSATNSSRSEVGEYRAECHLPGDFLNDGLYSVGLAVSSFDSGVRVHFFERGALMFNVRDPIEDTPTRKHGYSGVIPGAVRPQLDWTIRPLEKGGAR